MPGTYDVEGLSFQYPENWTIADAAHDQWPRTVSVHSPDGAFLSVFAYEKSHEPMELLADGLKSLREEYDDIDVELVEDELAGRECAGYDAHFYCLDFLVLAQLRAVVGEDYTYLFLAQGEHTQFNDLKLVFQAMMTSLMT